MGAPTSWLHLTLITSQSPYFQSPSHWGLGFHMDLRRRETLGPKQLFWWLRVDISVNHSRSVRSIISTTLLLVNYSTDPRGWKVSLWALSRGVVWQFHCPFAKRVMSSHTVPGENHRALNWHWKHHQVTNKKDVGMKEQDALVDAATKVCWGRAHRWP